MPNKIDFVQSRIRLACQRVGRDSSSVTLVGISKKQPAQVIREAFSLGVKTFGENYLQEALPKQKELSDLPIDWHFTGRLQRKKVKTVVQAFALIHSVDSVELAFEINKRAQEQNKRQNVLIQINIGDEQTKGGIGASDAEGFFGAISECQYLVPTGLMAMPPLVAQQNVARGFFSQMRNLRDYLNNKFVQLNLHELSMGTSDDFELAIEEGATMVRIGTALLGER